MPIFSCVVNEASPRLDRYISETLALLSRSQIKARELTAKVNGKEVKLSRPVKTGDSLELFWEEAPSENIIPQDLPLDIIYEDDRCIVVNKAQGMVVHPGAGNRQGTLANAIYYRILSKKNNNNMMKEDISFAAPYSLRPGIVHRLDKDTSGVIIATYDEEMHAFLANQFKNRKVRKTYIAIVCRAPGLQCKLEKKGKIESFIARDIRDRKKFTVSERGKRALTYYKVVRNFNNYSIILLRPKTGRTHQLRVHMRHIGCPILGDPIYGGADKNFPKATLMLHAKKLEITLMGENHPSIFSAPVPERFKEIWK